jgi:hypothetical protein
MARRRRRIRHGLGDMWARFWWGQKDYSWWLDVERPALRAYRAEQRAQRRRRRR